MATYTVLFDAVNYMRKSELAGRPEHVTARRGEVVELEGADADRLVEAGAVVEGEVDPATYEAERQAEADAAAREAAADDADATADRNAVMPEADLNTGATTTAEADEGSEPADDESTTSSGRRRR